MTLRSDTIHISTLQRAGIAAGLVGAIVLPSLTLLAAALWLAIRIASYLRANVTMATIADWQRNVDHRRPEEVLARPVLTFTDTPANAGRSSPRELSTTPPPRTAACYPRVNSPFAIVRGRSLRNSTIPVSGSPFPRCCARSLVLGSFSTSFSARRSCAS